MIDSTIVIVASAFAFIASYLMIPRFMAFLESSQIVGIDQQKKNTPFRPSSGGLIVAFGILGGLMFFIAVKL